MFAWRSTNRGEGVLHTLTPLRVVTAFTPIRVFLSCHGCLSGRHWSRRLLKTSTLSQSGRTSSPAPLYLGIWDPRSGIRDLGSGIHTGGMQDKNCSREGDKEWMRWKSQKLQTLQTSSTLICCCRPTCSADMSYSLQFNAMVGTTADVPLKVSSKCEVQTLLDKVKL